VLGLHAADYGLDYYRAAERFIVLMPYEAHHLAERLAQPPVEGKGRWGRKRFLVKDYPVPVVVRTSFVHFLPLTLLCLVGIIELVNALRPPTQPLPSSARGSHQSSPWPPEFVNAPLAKLVGYLDDDAYTAIQAKKLVEPYFGHWIKVSLVASRRPSVCAIQRPWPNQRSALRLRSSPQHCCSYATTLNSDIYLIP
jgi:hypothetical protein